MHRCRYIWYTGPVCLSQHTTVVHTRPRMRRSGPRKPSPWCHAPTTSLARMPMDAWSSVAHCSSHSPGDCAIMSTTAAVPGITPSPATEAPPRPPPLPATASLPLAAGGCCCPAVAAVAAMPLTGCSSCPGTTRVWMSASVPARPQAGRRGRVFGGGGAAVPCLVSMSWLCQATQQHAGAHRARAAFLSCWCSGAARVG